jgi:hypothetical protein
MDGSPSFDWSIVRDESAGNDQWRCDLRIEVVNRTQAETYSAFKAAVNTFSAAQTVNPERVMKASANSIRHVARFAWLTLNFSTDGSTGAVVVDASVWSSSMIGLARGAAHRCVKRLIEALPDALSAD